MLRKYKCGCIGTFEPLETISAYYAATSLFIDCNKSFLHFLFQNPDKHCVRGMVKHETPMTELEMAIYDLS